MGNPCLQWLPFASWMLSNSFLVQCMRRFRLVSGLVAFLMWDHLASESSAVVTEAWLLCYNLVLFLTSEPYSLSSVFAVLDFLLGQLSLVESSFALGLKPTWTQVEVWPWRCHSISAVSRSSLKLSSVPLWAPEVLQPCVSPSQHWPSCVALAYVSSPNHEQLRWEAVSAQCLGKSFGVSLEYLLVMSWMCP